MWKRVLQYLTIWFVMTMILLFKTVLEVMGHTDPSARAIIPFMPFIIPFMAVYVLPFAICVIAIWEAIWYFWKGRHVSNQ